MTAYFCGPNVPPNLMGYFRWHHSLTSNNTRFLKLIAFQTYDVISNNWEILRRSPSLDFLALSKYHC